MPIIRYPEQGGNFGKWECNQVYTTSLFHSLPQNDELLLVVLWWQTTGNRSIDRWHELVCRTTSKRKEKRIAGRNKREEKNWEEEEE